MKSKPHWTKKVPTAPGLYWYRINVVGSEPVIGATHNAGKEFTFIGTDEAASPEDMRKEGVEFWSEPLAPPEEAS